MATPFDGSDVDMSLGDRLARALAASGRRRRRRRALPSTCQLGWTRWEPRWEGGHRDDASTACPGEGDEEDPAGGTWVGGSSSSSDVDTWRARREFAAGGAATCVAASVDGRHVVYASFQPPDRTKTALSVARERYGAPLDAGGEEAADAGGTEGAGGGGDRRGGGGRGGGALQPGGDGGIVVDSTHTFSGAVTSQVQFLSNLAGFDDFSAGTRCVLLEAGRRRHRLRGKLGGWRKACRDALWGHGRAGGKEEFSPEVSAFGAIHADSLGDCTVELELKKQAKARPSGGGGGGGSEPKESDERGSSRFLAWPWLGRTRPRLTLLSEAFIFNLGVDPRPPRMEVLVAGEMGGEPGGGGEDSGGAEGGTVHIRGKLTTDLAGTTHRFAVESQGVVTPHRGNLTNTRGGQTRAWAYHNRYVTDFGREHTLRTRFVSRPVSLSSFSRVDPAGDPSPAPSPGPGGPLAAALANATLTVTSVVKLPPMFAQREGGDHFHSDEGGGTGGWLGVDHVRNNLESSLELSTHGKRPKERGSQVKDDSSSPTAGPDSCDPGEWQLDARVSSGIVRGRATHLRGWIRHSFTRRTGEPRAGSSSPRSPSSSTWAIVTGADCWEGPGIGFEWRREWNSGNDEWRSEDRMGNDASGSSGWPSPLDGHVIDRGGAPFVNVRVALCQGWGGPRGFLEFASPG